MNYSREFGGSLHSRKAGHVLTCVDETERCETKMANEWMHSNHEMNRRRGLGRVSCLSHLPMIDVENATMEAGQHSLCDLQYPVDGMEGSARALHSLTLRVRDMIDSELRDDSYRGEGMRS